ncbi:DUF262 domain-containing protein [Dellaglioa sp. P0083]|uniref:DUF262 domain-containing protein n=1 Tax=Dellaglioa kimchii TaxID=3344667 RepID=UPI0038D47161
MEEIKSEMETLNQVLLEGTKTYVIPDFQRNFIWGRDEVEDLFNDFSEDTESFSKSNSDLQGYLLGNIVLIESNSNEYLVIDGQQRLTTITLLFKALYQRISVILDEAENGERDQWVKRIGNLESGFQLSDEEFKFKGLRIKHAEGLSFGEYYRKIIRDSRDTNDLEMESDKNILDVYDTITERLSELTNEQLTKFIVYIKTKVKLIVTIAPSEGKAFQLFEVLNDRGRSLEPMDLVKNTFLKQLRLDGFSEEETKNFNSNWNGFIEELTISEKKKIKSSTFMKHFIVANYSKNIKQDKLFDFFKKENKLSSNDILRLSQNMKSNAHIYTSIENDPLHNDFLSENNNMYIIFKILGMKQLHPILMQFYDADKPIKEEVVDICVKYGATIVFSLTQTNIVEKALPSVIKGISKVKDLKEKKDKLLDIVRGEAETSRQKLPNIIKKYNFNKSSGKPTTILKFIELYCNKNNLIVKPNKKISKEHILAEKTEISNYEEYGFSGEEEFKQYLNRMGNLTLLYTDENTSAGIKAISEKRNIYEKSEFMVTRTMVKNEETAIKNGLETEKLSVLNELEPAYNLEDVWSKQEIEDRGSNLSELLLKYIGL